MTPTPPDTALARLDEGERDPLDCLTQMEREVVHALQVYELSPYTADATIAIIRRLCASVRFAEGLAKIRHDASQLLLSQRDAEISKLEARIAEAADWLRMIGYKNMADYIEGKEKTG